MEMARNMVVNSNKFGGGYNSHIDKTLPLTTPFHRGALPAPSLYTVKNKKLIVNHFNNLQLTFIFTFNNNTLQWVLSSTKLHSI